MRILIIEDDKKLAKIIANILKDEKIHSDIYNDGDTGLEAALRGAYEVAIIDWMLPGRDGPFNLPGDQSRPPGNGITAPYCPRTGGRPRGRIGQRGR